MTDISPLLGLFVQVPLVGVFIWFVLTWSKLLQDAETKRQEDLKNFLGQLRQVDHEIIITLAREVSALKDLVLRHDQQTSEAITLMIDRTGRRRDREKQEVINNAKLDEGQKR